MRHIEKLFLFLFFISVSKPQASELDNNMEIKAFSSEISEGTIGDNIFKIIKNAERRIIIASDKCTNEEFLDDLIGLPNFSNLEIHIVTGPDRSTSQTFEKDKFKNKFIFNALQSNPDGSGKMHNKFIILDDITVITGSPNLTFAAYNYNIESFVAIKNRLISNLYYLYYQYLISEKDKYDRSTEEYTSVNQEMLDFNQRPFPVKVCLAPISNIKDFILQGLESSSIININMFLISRGSDPANDIVSKIITEASRNIPINIRVDGVQYDQQNYMRNALAPLKVFDNVSLSTVKKHPVEWQTRTRRIKTIPQFHDKLLLLEQEETKKVFIGSAGFTDNVQDNLNLENMILIEDQDTYDFFLSHFRSIEEERADLEMIKL